MDIMVIFGHLSISASIIIGIFVHFAHSSAKYFLIDKLQHEYIKNAAVGKIFTSFAA